MVCFDVGTTASNIFLPFLPSSSRCTWSFSSMSGSLVPIPIFCCLLSSLNVLGTPPDRIVLYVPSLTVVCDHLANPHLQLTQPSGYLQDLLLPLYLSSVSLWLCSRLWRVGVACQLVPISDHSLQHHHTPYVSSSINILLR